MSGSNEVARRCCAACRGPDPPYRCTTCRSAWYCGQPCQQLDWKHHRRYCRAAKELERILRRTTPRQAEQQYYAASDLMDDLVVRQSSTETCAVQLLGTSQSPRATQPPRVGTATMPSSIATGRRDNDGNASTSSLLEDNEGSQSLTVTRPLDVPRVPPGLRSQQRKAPCVPPMSRFRIQHMPNLSSYQLQMIRNDDDNKEGDDWIPSIQTLECRLEYMDCDNSTICTLMTENQLVLLSLKLPGKIVDVTSYSSPTTPGCFRLSYQPLSADVRTSPKSVVKASDLSAAARCRSCGQPLMDETSSSPPIQRILPLHSGRWHDMMDYLVCYPGQPAIDLGSNSLLIAPTTSLSSSQIAMEDDIAFVVLQDLETSGAVAVLAIPGYGEDPRREDSEGPNSLDLEGGWLDTSATRRGSRPWQDWIGGATLTCSTCASILGYATVLDEPRDAGTGVASTSSSCLSPSAERPSVSAFRLLKHRIAWSSTAGRNDGYGVVDFVMREMIRYSEAKAIFSFQVTCEGRWNECILLRILSWDSEASTHNEGWDAPGYGGPLEIEWRRLVRVLYEECRVEDVAPLRTEFQWMWDKDWCCSPNAKEEKSEEYPADLSASIVRLFLELEEYNQLRHDLRQASDWYSEDAKQATILSKIGRLSAKMGFAAILL